MKTLIIADIHGNAPAFEAVIKKEKTWDYLIFLGDAIVGGPFPNEVLSLLKRNEGVFIKGNHDDEIDEIRHLISNENLEFCKSFTAASVIEIEGVKYQLHHGDFNIKDPYFTPLTPIQEIRALAYQFQPDIMLFGNSHIQFEMQVGKTLFFNPGSVGQPRTGKVIACYATLENGILRHCKVSYDPTPVICKWAEMNHLNAETISCWQDRVRSGWVIRNKLWLELSRLGYK